MPKQTDDLMLLGDHYEEDAKELEQKLKDKDEMKRRLRLMQELQQSVAFQVYIMQLNEELGAAMSMMEKTTDPIAQAKAVGAYCTLKRSVEFVDAEAAQLAQMLK